MTDYVAAIGMAAAMEGLAEEATELAHAAQKYARILRGENPTPVTLEGARINLVEETVDVQITQDAIATHCPDIYNGYMTVFKIKTERLDERISAMIEEKKVHQ